MPHQEQGPDIRSLPPAGLAIDPRQQDAYWSEAYATERYVRAGLDYEDYAPAYCVGYVGYAQYGLPWEDAETSLCANWARIKGGSRLTWPEARPAIRAAWERVDSQARLAALGAPMPGPHRQAGDDAPSAGPSAAREAAPALV